MIWGWIVKYPRLFGYGVLVVAVIVGVLVVNGWRKDAERLTELQEKVNSFVAKQEAAEKISAGYQKTVAELKARNRKLNESLEDEVQKNAAYAECVLTAAGLSLVNQRIEGQPSGGSD